MSEIESRFVHRGLWRDTSQSSSMGAIITADTRTGTLVVALLAILCSLSMTHLWHLIAFIIHQSRADGRPADGIFRQQQAILRTFPTPGTLATDFARICWSWRSIHIQRAWMRSVPLALFGLLFGFATIVIGIFSSYAVDTTNLQVVAESPFCGLVEITESDTAGLFANYTPIVQNLATSLAQECYDVTSPSTRCSIYLKPRIDFSISSAECPWEPSACLQGGSTVAMDSGLLDVNDAFGLNLDSRDRLQFRKRTTCAVLPLENRTTVISATAYPGYSRATLPEEELLILSFGNFPGNSTWRNATFVMSLARSNITNDFTVRKFASYAEPAWDYKGVLYLEPELAHNDADIVLKLIVKGAVAYDVPVDDPVFSAHQEFTTIDETDGSNVTFFFSDFPASVVGCTQQYQFCLSSDRCTSLGNLPRSLNSSDFPEASGIQLTVLQLLISSAYTFDISGSQTIRASSGMRINGYISSLPDDQWKTEAIGWESEAWAALQIAIGDYFTGVKARDDYADSYSRPASSEAEKQLCAKFRMRKTGGFVNISVFALAFVCTFSVIVVVTDIVLLRCLIYLSQLRRMQWLGPRIDRWTQDSVLQLQRRAFESAGQGKWEGHHQEVPINTEQAMLIDLSLDELVGEHTEEKDSLGTIERVGKVASDQG